MVLRYEPSDRGLPYLKVKLIRKKGGAFPMVTLKKDLELTGSKPGATLKMYDDDRLGSPATVVEMDGEIDLDNLEAQLGRGGVKVDGGLRTADPSIYAIGECAPIGGSFCYGLWAPGVEQAEVLVKNLVDGPGSAEYSSSDLSTMLKLLGVGVASFGAHNECLLEAVVWRRGSHGCLPGVFHPI